VAGLLGWREEQGLQIISMEPFQRRSSADTLKSHGSFEFGFDYSQLLKGLFLFLSRYIK
jgi:hypothetical protein